MNETERRIRINAAHAEIAKRRPYWTLYGRPLLPWAIAIGLAVVAFMVLVRNVEITGFGVLTSVVIALALFVLWKIVMIFRW